MLKQTTKLKFKSVRALWMFAQRVSVTNMEINTREQTIICECSEAELALAREEFGATLGEQSLPTFQRKTA